MTACDIIETSSSTQKTYIEISVIGAGWWSQGWHLPHLKNNSKNRNVKISAIVDVSPHPKSSLNPDLESLEQLSIRYACPIFSSVDDLLQSDTGKLLDGVIICTPHATHYNIAKKFLLESMARQNVGKTGIHILLEKPMTTDVEEAKALHSLVSECQSLPNPGFFQINHTANFRPQTFAAKRILSTTPIATVSAFFASPLSWLFDNPSNVHWNEPTSESMLGNGFTWGQMSHCIAWIVQVTNIRPLSVYCIMNHSSETGADVSHSATVKCYNDIILSLSGTSLLPGYQHASPPVAKLVEIEIVGKDGAMVTYIGNDLDLTSGGLEHWTTSSQGDKTENQKENLGFQFEDSERGNDGPASMQQFLNACFGMKYDIGADTNVGMVAVQIIEAMYRSQLSGEVEAIR